MEDEKKKIEKRFPAVTSIDTLTFLSDDKVDAELYALFQEKSSVEELEDGTKRTVVWKKDLPTQKVMCDILGIGTPKTFRTHRAYLIEHGYIVEEQDKYVLPNKEDVFLMIPLKTLQFLNDVLKEQVIKVYVYLGQRWKYKEGYVFTYNELAQHTGGSGANDARQNRVVANAVACLQKLGLIDYVEFSEWNPVIQKSVPKKRLTSVKFELDG